MKKLRKVLVLLGFILIYICSGCGEKTDSVDISELPDISTEEPKTGFQEPYFIYTPNHPYQKNTRYTENSIYVSTSNGLYRRGSESDDWIKMDDGNIMLGDIYEDKIYYGKGNQVRAINLETNNIEDIMQCEEKVENVTIFEKSSGEKIINYIHPERYVEAYILNEQNMPTQRLTDTDDYGYYGGSNNYHYLKTELGWTETQIEQSLSSYVEELDPCFSTKQYGRRYGSDWEPGINNRKLWRRYDNDITYITPFFNKCLITNWGSIYYDKREIKNIYIITHENWEVKQIWDGVTYGSFDLVNYDNDYVYGIYQKDENSEKYIARIPYRGSGIELLFSAEDMAESQFDVASEWIYYENKSGKFLRINMNTFEQEKIGN